MKQQTPAPSHAPKVPLWIETTPAIKKKLFALASREERSVNQVANRLLRRFLADWEKAHGPLLTPEEKVG